MSEVGQTFLSIYVIFMSGIGAINGINKRGAETILGRLGYIVLGVTCAITLPFTLIADAAMNALDKCLPPSHYQVT